MVSIIIPTYNERENLDVLLARFIAVKAASDEPLEMFVVDDRSPDGTAAYARTLLHHARLGRVIERGGARDLTLAVLEGARQATGDLIGVMDADLSHPPEVLPALVAAVRSGNDVAVASRYIKGGGITGWSWHRRWLSRLGNLAARPLVPVADATSGYFVCRRDLITSLPLQSRGFKLLLQVLVEGNVQQIKEIPYTFQDRRRGSSKLRGRVLWLYGLQLVRLYWHRLRHPRHLMMATGNG